MLLVLQVYAARVAMGLRLAKKIARQVPLGEVRLAFVLCNRFTFCDLPSLFGLLLIRLAPIRKLCAKGVLILYLLGGPPVCLCSTGEQIG